MDILTRNTYKPSGSNTITGSLRKIKYKYRELRIESIFETINEMQHTFP
jgi:hypothetical protein